MAHQIQKFPLKAVERKVGTSSLGDIVNVKSVCNNSLDGLYSSNSAIVNIERVPPEVLEEIFDNLSQEDIANVRLVCRKWMELSSPLYLNAMNITLRTRPLMIAGFVAQHQFFRRGIKLLAIDIAQFSRNLALDRQQYANAIIKQLLREMKANIGDDVEKLDLVGAVMRWRDVPTMSAQAGVGVSSHYSEEDDGSQHTLDLLVQGWSEYAQLFEQQQTILRTISLVGLLSRALASLPRVRHLSFKSSWNSRRSISEKGGKNCLRPYCLAPEVDEETPPSQLVDFFEAWNKTGKPLETFDFSSSAMFLAAAQKPLTPSSMTIFRHTREVSIQYGSTLVEVFRTTRDIEAEKIQSGYLSTLLSAASSVEHICLRGAKNLFFTDTPVTLKPILGITHWPKLQTLCLETMEIDFEELEGLCERQQETLTSLVIQRASLFGGTWAGALPVVRKLKKLRLVVLAFLWHGKEMTDFVVEDDPEDAVRKYILEGGLNPLGTSLSPSS